MNAFVIFNLNSNNYLHSTKEGGTDHITCAYMTLSRDMAEHECEIANSEFLCCTWVVRSITITLNV